MKFSRIFYVLSQYWRQRGCASGGAQVAEQLRKGQLSPLQWRKGIGKKAGAMLQLKLQVDTKPYELNKEFMECLADEPKALEIVRTLRHAFPQLRILARAVGIIHEQTRHAASRPRSRPACE